MIARRYRERLGGTTGPVLSGHHSSDSDMLRSASPSPWTEAKAIADGPSILNYLDEAVRDCMGSTSIRYSTRVTGAEGWSTEDAQWTVTARRAGEAVTFTCALFLCTGYYNYERGFHARLRQGSRLQEAGSSSAILERRHRLQECGASW